MLVPENFIGINKAKIEIEIGINVDGIVEYTPLGVFYVDEYTTKNDYKSVKITAFDAMYKITEKLGDNYICGLSRTNVTVDRVRTFYSKMVILHMKAITQSVQQISFLYLKAQRILPSSFTVLMIYQRQM